MVWTRKKALKDVTILTISQYTVQFITALKGFLFAKYLGPEGLGVWASIYLIYTYGQYCHFGVFNGAVILVPEKIGAGKIDEANKLLSSAITWMNIFGLLFFIIMAIYVFFSKSLFITTNWLPLVIASFAVPVYLNYNFSIYRLQFQHNFKKSGIYQALFAILDLIISLTLMFLFGITGAFAGMLSSLFIVTFLVTRNGYKDLLVLFDKKTFIRLFKVGSQLLLISFGFVLLTTADKFSVANFFSKIDMGLFSMATNVAMVPYTIGIALQGIVSQRMLEEYGKTKEINSIKIFLDESIFAVAFLVPLFSVLLNTLTEPLITLLLPKYVGSLQYIDKLSIGIYFLAISIMCYSFMIVITKYFTIMILQILLIVSVVFCNSLIANTIYGLLGVSIITILNYLFFALFLYFFCYLHFYKIKKTLWMFLRVLLPASIILLSFSLKLIIFDSAVRFGIRMLVALSWGIFAYVYLSKKTTILSQIISTIKQKIFHKFRIIMKEFSS